MIGRFAVRQGFAEFGPESGGQSRGIGHAVVLEVTMAVTIIVIVIVVVLLAGERCSSGSVPSTTGSRRR